MREDFLIEGIRVTRVKKNEDYQITVDNTRVFKSIEIAKRLNSGFLTFAIGYYKSEDISFLWDYDLSFVKKVSINTVLRDLRPLYALPQLSELYIGSYGQGKRELDFSFFPMLKRLSAEVNKAWIGLNMCKEMKNLTLRKFKKENLLSISELKKLETLSLVTTQIRNVEGIESLVNLKYLDIHSAPKLINLKGLHEGLVNLNKIALYNVRNLKSLDELESLKNLTYLGVYNALNLKNLNFLDKITTLKVLGISKGKVKVLSGDYRPLERAEQRIVQIPNNEQYSPFSQK